MTLLLVMESVKVGPGLYLAQGSTIDDSLYPDRLDKFNELLERGLLAEVASAPAVKPVEEAETAQDEKPKTQKKGK